MSTSETEDICNNNDLPVTRSVTNPFTSSVDYNVAKMSPSGTEDSSNNPSTSSFDNSIPEMSTTDIDHNSNIIVPVVKRSKNTDTSLSFFDNLENAVKSKPDDVNKMFSVICSFCKGNQVINAKTLVSKMKTLEYKYRVTTLTQEYINSTLDFPNICNVCGDTARPQFETHRYLPKRLDTREFYKDLEIKRLVSSEFEHVFQLSTNNDCVLKHFTTFDEVKTWVQAELHSKGEHDSILKLRNTSLFNHVSKHSISTVMFNKWFNEEILCFLTDVISFYSRNRLSNNSSIPTWHFGHPRDFTSWEEDLKNCRTSSNPGKQFHYLYKHKNMGMITRVFADSQIGHGRRVLNFTTTLHKDSHWVLMTISRSSDNKLHVSLLDHLTSHSESTYKFEINFIAFIMKLSIIEESRHLTDDDFADYFRNADLPYYDNIESDTKAKLHFSQDDSYNCGVIAFINLLRTVHPEKKIVNQEDYTHRMMNIRLGILNLIKGVYDILLKINTVTIEDDVDDTDNSNDVITTLNSKDVITNEDSFNLSDFIHLRFKNHKITTFNVQKMDCPTSLLYNDIVLPFVRLFLSDDHYYDVIMNEATGIYCSFEYRNTSCSLECAAVVECNVVVNDYIVMIIHNFFINKINKSTILIIRNFIHRIIHKAITTKHCYIFIKTKNIQCLHNSQEEIMSIFTTNLNMFRQWNGLPIGTLHSSSQVVNTDYSNSNTYAYIDNDKDLLYISTQLEYNKCKRQLGVIEEFRCCSFVVPLPAARRSYVTIPDIITSIDIANCTPSKRIIFHDVSSIEIIIQKRDNSLQGSIASPRSGVDHIIRNLTDNINQRSEDTSQQLLNLSKKYGLYCMFTTNEGSADSDDCWILACASVLEFNVTLGTTKTVLVHHLDYFNDITSLTAFVHAIMCIASERRHELVSVVYNKYVNDVPILKTTQSESIATFLNETLKFTQTTDNDLYLGNLQEGTYNTMYCFVQEYKFHMKSKFGCFDMLQKHRFCCIRDVNPVKVKCLQSTDGEYSTQLYTHAFGWNDATIEDMNLISEHTKLACRQHVGQEFILYRTGKRSKNKYCSDHNVLFSDLELPKTYRQSSYPGRNNCLWLALCGMLYLHNEHAANILVTSFQQDPQTYEGMLFKNQHKFGSLATVLNKHVAYQLRNVHIPNRRDDKYYVNKLLSESKEEGKLYLVQLLTNAKQNYHVVGVDTKKQLIIDCMEDNYIRLSMEGFNLCCGDGYVLDNITYCYEICEIPTNPKKRKKKK